MHCISSNQSFTNNVLTFVVANRLNIYRMESFAIYEIVFVVCWPLDPNMGSVYAPNNSWEPSLAIKAFLHLLDFVVRRQHDELVLFASKSF